MVRRVALIAAACAVLAGGARADGLSAEDLARKPEGGHVTAFPLIAYSSDFGLGGGARAYYFWNGARRDPRFATTPYLHRLFVQGFASTGGTQLYWVDYDAPALAGSAYRVRAQATLNRNTAQNYFGLGDDARELRYPGDPRTFTRFADYEDAQRRAIDGATYARYDHYDYLHPEALASLERTVAPGLRALVGIGIAYTRIGDYTGERVDATGGEAVQAPTRLREDCDAGLLVGCDGGRDHFARLALAYDTRDYEPDPNRGAFVELAIDAGTAALGSEYDYLRLLASARGWWSPLGSRADVVLAGRVFALLQSPGTPFWKLSTLPFTEDPRFGLGGHRTLRGFRQDRFVGHAMSAANAELRWTFARATLGGQRFALIAAPFVDAGRAFGAPIELDVRGWRVTAGGALRISWNLSTLITFDYGVSGEGSGFYVNFGHVF